jgi:hypothetical protein
VEGGEASADGGEDVTAAEGEEEDDGWVEAGGGAEDDSCFTSIYSCFTSILGWRCGRYCGFLSVSPPPPNPPVCLASPPSPLPLPLSDSVHLSLSTHPRTHPCPTHPITNPSTISGKTKTTLRKVDMERSPVSRCFGGVLKTTIRYSASKASGRCNVCNVCNAGPCARRRFQDDE